MGIFAERNFKKDEIMHKEETVLLSKNDNKILFLETPQERINCDTGIHTYPVYDKLAFGSDCFMNHSCLPNSGSVIDGKDFYIIALKDITEGDEITCDYDCFHWENDYPFDCCCNTNMCRGHIKGFSNLTTKQQKNLLPQVQSDIREKYLSLKTFKAKA